MMGATHSSLSVDFAKRLLMTSSASKPIALSRRTALGAGGVGLVAVLSACARTVLSGVSVRCIRQLILLNLNRRVRARLLRRRCRLRIRRIRVRSRSITLRRTASTFLPLREEGTEPAQTDHAGEGAGAEY
mgnify:CR=1 FL=1